jgi:four helix bundle protein
MRVGVRNHTRLRAFHQADELAIGVYDATRQMPIDERFGLQAQLRRAAVSVPTNIVEGSSRGSTREYCHYLEVALGSARETRYLLDLSTKLGFLRPQAAALANRYDELCAILAAVIRTQRQRTLDPD